MTSDLRGTRPALRPALRLTGVAGLALVPALVWFVIDGRLGIDLSDEGFLWYGSTALRQGLVPIRDFQAYDPGRYAWTAAWSFLFGESLVALRFACVLFGSAGILAGLLVARRLGTSLFFHVCVALALCLWMSPRYKVFDSSLALVSVWAGVRLLERPSIARHLGVGLLGGAAAVFGRNHGLYHLVAFGALIAWAAHGVGGRESARRVAAWVLGLILGFLPQIALCALVPRYIDAFRGSLDEVFRKGTNLAVQTPWPWLAPANLPAWPRASLIAIGCFFVAIPAFLALAALRGVRLRRAGLAARPVLLATIGVGVPYAHYVFSRPDVVHLAHGAGVLVLGLLALAASFEGAFARWRTLLAPGLLAASALATLLWTTKSVEVAMFPERFPSVDVGGVRMRVAERDARTLASARELALNRARPDEPVFFAPNQPGLYPFTRRRSPTREIYLIHPATPAEDRALRDELESVGVQWAMIRDYALDDREDLRFVNTNPLVARYLRDNFAPVRLEGLPDDELVVRRMPRR